MRFIGIIVGLLICISQSATASDGWLEYGPAYRESTAQDKPLLVLIGATWCAPCKRLRQELDRLPAEELRVVVRAHVDLDCERSTAVKLMRGTSTVPQLILFYRDEQRVWRRVGLVGVQSRERITDLIRKAKPKN